MILPVVQLIGGLIALVYAGNALIRGSVSMAGRLGMSAMLIGSTVVAFGTSAPELLVSLVAAYNDNDSIATGNVVGSNIANISLILGATVIILPMVISRSFIRFDWRWLMIFSVVFYIVAFDLLVSRLESGLLLALLIAFIVMSIRAGKAPEVGTDEISASDSKWATALRIVFGIAGLAVGAHYFVNGAAVIARELGVAEKVIGVTLVAFGTSVPELAASIAAALKKQADISLGNLVGSNIFNIGCIMGISGLISPLSVAPEMASVDFPVMLAIAAFFLPAYFFGKLLGRFRGSILIISYLTYVAFNFNLI